MKRWLVVLALCATAAAPVPVVQTKADPILVESVAFDARGRMLVSTIHAAGVYRIGRDGRLLRWSQDTTGQAKDAAIFGIVADPLRNALWAATSGTPYGGSLTIGPALLRFDLRNGRLRQVIGGGAGTARFGDIALGPDGTVFVSDSAAGAVFKLAPGAAALQPVIELDGAKDSPQGLVVSDDGRTLVFANYRDGLHRIDLLTGAHARLAGPEGIDIRGVDGVTRRGDMLILVRNATAPARVIRVMLNADWTAITSADVLAEGSPMSEPTGGVIRGDEFVFVSRSQWTDFGEDGQPQPTLAPAIISRLRIPPPEPPPPETRSGG